MAEEIDWHGVNKAAAAGRLMALLETLPRNCWTERDPITDYTLLHYACWGNHVAVVAALLAQGLDVNARAKSGWSPAHVAVVNHKARVLKVLCAAGAALRATNLHGDSLLDSALFTHTTECMHVLLANGVRLSTASNKCLRFITPELMAFERGVLCCRAAVVTMMRVKRAGKLVRWDRFLLAHMAREIWMTRYSPQWQLSVAHAGIAITTTTSSKGVAARPCSLQ